MKSPFVLALVIASLVPQVRAQQSEPPKAEVAAAKLGVGSPAPEFKPVKWLQGEPVETFEKDKVYLMEFWATWCGPCIAGIPHLNELHNKFKDKGLVVVGVNVWETAPDKTAEFVKKKGADMAYRIAYDGEKTGHTSTNWLKPAGVNGIPHAIVIRDNKVLWKGHPGGLSEAMMGEMIAGTFDGAKAAAEAEKAEANRAEFTKALREFRTALSGKQFEDAEKNLARAVEFAPKAGIPAARVTNLEKSGKVDIAIGKGESAKAVALIKEMAPAGGTGREAALGWFTVSQKMATTPGLEGRDYQFALESLDKCKAADPEFAKDAVIKFLLARVQDGAGKKEDAIKTLEEISSGSSVPASMVKVIDSAREALKAGKPWPQDVLSRGSL